MKLKVNPNPGCLGYIFQIRKGVSLNTNIFEGRALNVPGFSIKAMIVSKSNLDLLFQSAGFSGESC